MPASASAAQIRYLEETTRGETPTGNPSELRVTGESLNQSVESAASQELRNDRMTPDSILTGGQVGGGLNIELSFGTYDDFLEALLADTFTTIGTDSSAEISDAVFAASDNSLSSAGTNIPATNLSKGQWLRVEGTQLNDGVYKLSKTQNITTGKIYFDSEVKICVDETWGCYLESARLKNGTADLRTFSIEKEFTDITPNQHFMYTGCGVESLTLDFSTGSILTGTINFLGQDSDRDTDTMFPSGLGSVISATTTPVMNSVQGTTVLLDGVSLGESCAESFSLSVGTGLRGIRCLGSGIGFSDVVVGTFEITGSLNIFFGAASSAQVYDKMIENQALSFSIAVTDANGDGYGFNIDRAKLTSSEIVAGGINTDVIMALGITATIDTVSNAMLSIDRIGSPTVDNPSASPSASVSPSPS